MSIFDKLNGVCYSVVISITTMKLKGIDMHMSDYFLVSKNNKSLEKFGFSERNSRIMTRDLTDNESEQFKKILDRFEKVLHTPEGRVYELKRCGFKKMLEFCDDNVEIEPLLLDSFMHTMYDGTLSSRENQERLYEYVEKST